MVYVKLGTQQKLARILQRWIAKENRRYASGGGGGVTGLISKAFTLSLIGAAGVAGYAYYDPEFRRKVNKTCPQAKSILDAVLPNKKESGEEMIPGKIGQRNFPAPIFMSSEGDHYEYTSKTVPPVKQYDKEEIAKIAEEVFEQKYKQQHSAASTTEDFSTAKQLWKTSYEEELKEALLRQAEEQAKHEEEILRLQRESMAEQNKKDIQEAVLNERQEYNKHLLSTINKLDALEKFLNERTDVDNQNRKAKKLWIVSQSLKATLTKGKDDNEIKTFHRINLSKEIDALKEAASDDEVVKQLITLVPEKALTVGVCPEQELIERFRKVKNLCRATARVGDDGGNLFQYFLSYLQSKFYWDTFKETTDSTEIDVNNASTYDILSRVSYCMDQKDYDSVVRLMSLLKGEPSQLSSDWVNDTRLFLETRQWADILLAHASALSVRTLY